MSSFEKFPSSEAPEESFETIPADQEAQLDGPSAELQAKTILHRTANEIGSCNYIPLPPFELVKQITYQYGQDHSSKYDLGQVYATVESPMEWLDLALGVDLRPFQIKGYPEILLIDITTNPHNILHKIDNHFNSATVFGKLFGKQAAPLIILCDKPISAECFDTELISWLDLNPAQRPAWIKTSELNQYASGDETPTTWIERSAQYPAIKPNLSQDTSKPSLNNTPPKTLKPNSVSVSKALARPKR